MPPVVIAFCRATIALALVAEPGPWPVAPAAILVGSARIADDIVIRPAAPGGPVADVKSKKMPPAVAGQVGAERVLAR